jgi:hexulose-6-phosphate isomerase
MPKKCLNQWTVAGFEGAVGVIESARAVKEAGFEAIELCFGAGDFTAETPESQIEAYRQEIETLGLEISSLATGMYWSKSLSSPTETERSEAIEFTRSYVKAASTIGVDSVLVVPGAVAVPWDPSRPVVPARIAHELSRKSIRSLLPLAQDLGVHLCVENVWNKFLTGPFEFASFIDSFGSPYVKAYFDVGNALLFGYPEHWIEVLGDRIGRIHIKNFKTTGGGGTLDGFTGSLLEGDVDWALVFEAIDSIGYNGFLTAEMLVSEKGLPDNEMAMRTSVEMTELLKRHSSGKS